MDPSQQTLRTSTAEVGGQGGGQGGHSREIGLRGGRLVTIMWAVLFYGFFSVILIIDQGKQLF